ncbi:recombinase family protein (plasmid) [Cupriavidus basilensis]|uniref:Recombinase family protein n=1 Tax=Cupriavidus basilensis TaxID=68895 RepID=A0A643FHK5_9BURK|nr:recombinase family protein [Cupriavidus basilensis]QOT82488.1 recombinase family protein [Cupriavidus basilensis]
MLIGYARVSTEEQVTHAQIDALRAAGCETIYQEKRSGGTMRRPELEMVLATVGKGDTVVVYKLDRIARSLKDLLTIIERIEQAGGEFRSLTEHMDTRSPAGRMIFQIIGAFAEFERELIRERTRVGMAAAVRRGVRLGRHTAMNADQEAECMRLWYSGDYTKTALAQRYGTHISSIKRAIKRNQSVELARAA